MKKSDKRANQACGRCGKQEGGESGICLKCIAKLSKDTLMRSFLSPEEKIQRLNLCGPRVRLARKNDPNNKITYVK